MSIQEIGIVLNHSQALGTTKMVLMGIAWHTGKDRLLGCYPSQQTLAAYANCSTRQVRRCLDELVALDELHIIINGSFRRGSNAATNLYTIILDCPDYCDKSMNHTFLGDALMEDEADICDTSSGHLGQVKRTSGAGQADISVL
jgi:hypothetical protein